MKNSKQILGQVEQKIARSQNNLATPAGPRKEEKIFSQEQKEALAKAINESFELLRINYQHLYFSAYSEIDALNAAKRLWMESLSDYPAESILQAVHRLIKQSDYLPTISRVIRQCVELTSNHALPNVHSAYIEACRAPSPKRNARWSHPAVYYAGKKSDWYFIANNSEKTVFPIFKSHYEKICQQVLSGEELPEVSPLALPDKNTEALSKEENSKRMEKMREELGL